MARHRSDAVGRVASTPVTADAHTFVTAAVTAAAPPAPTLVGTPPAPALPVPAIPAPALPVPAIPAPAIPSAPETNPLDLAAIALAAARTPAGTPLPPAPPSPALGIPIARSAPPISRPFPASPISGPVPTAHVAPRADPGGSLGRLLGARRTVAVLAIVGAVVGAGVAIVGVSSALTRPSTPVPTQNAPTQNAPAQQAPASQGDYSSEGSSGY